MWAAHQAIIIALLVYPVHTVDEQSVEEENFQAFYTCYLLLGTEEKVPQNIVGESFGDILCHIVCRLFTKHFFNYKIHLLINLVEILMKYRGYTRKV